MATKVIKKPVPKDLQPAPDQTQAALPGNAGAAQAPIQNAQPLPQAPVAKTAPKKKTGFQGFASKSKLPKQAAING